jgi:RNA polymerase sigma-70 factor (ECF subfamily)
VKTKPLIDIKELVDAYGLTISRMAHRMIQNKEIAKEASQEVWYEIVKSVHTFRGESSITTWIYTIARRTLFKYAQNEKIYSDHEIAENFEKEEIFFPGRESDSKDWIKEKCDWCLTAFCHCLSNEARIIFLFREIAGIPYRQIADIMETNETNIRKILSRSHRKVKNFMEKNCILFNPEGECKCRIRSLITNIDLQRTYSDLSHTARLVDFYLRFDKELPRKNYWEKILSQTVTK